MKKPLIGCIVSIILCICTLSVCDEELQSEADCVEIMQSSVELDDAKTDSVLEYDSWMDFKEERELPYADEQTFEVIKGAYADVNFFGEFKEGKEDICDRYKEGFAKMLRNEVSFLDKETGEKIYITNYGRFESEYDVNQYTYYFFDVDEDENNTPELVIRNGAGEMDVFQYNSEAEECVLWCKLESYWYSLIGSKKVMWPWDGKYLAFYELNSNGETEDITFGISNWFNEEESLHMVTMPVDAEGRNEKNVTEEMKTQGVFERSGGQWYFRVTEQQYDELMANYWAAYDLANEKIEGVTYTYEELVGGW